MKIEGDQTHNTFAIAEWLIELKISHLFGIK